MTKPGRASGTGGHGSDRGRLRQVEGPGLGALPEAGPEDQVQGVQGDRATPYHEAEDQVHPGSGAMRRRIFCRYRAMVLSAMHHGDSLLAAAYPAVETAPVIARFTWRDGRADDEPWGMWGDWR